MAAPTAPRKNFITRDHRYVYLGGSFIALLGLGMFYSAPSPYSFIPAQSVFGTALAAICWFFLGVSAMALLVKWAYWNNYSSTIMKRPLIVRVSRYLSYLDAAACALLVLDRFILKLAYIINVAIHADSNPTDTLSMMAYMAYNQRSLFAIGISYTVRLALFGTAIAFVLALLMVFLRIQEPGTAFGAPETSIVSVQLMEKGYADLELSVHSIGGHSSRPYGGTSLGRLSGAIADITRAPFAVRLNSAMAGAFETLAPYITQEPLKTLVQDVAGNADAIAACCMGSPDLFPFVTTTIAPTMIRGGSAACNVMPQDMTAVINFRIADGDSTESVMAHCREAVQDKGVEMRFLQANDPSAIARRDGYGYRTVVESFQRYYPEAVFIPSMAVGATDAHRYEEICDTCLRCSPFMTEPAEAASGVHGTNERLLVRSYLQGIRVLIDLMEHANVEP